MVCTCLQASLILSPICRSFNKIEHAPLVFCSNSALLHHLAGVCNAQEVTCIA